MDGDPFLDLLYAYDCQRRELIALANQRSNSPSASQSETDMEIIAIDTKFDEAEKIVLKETTTYLYNVWM